MLVLPKWLLLFTTKLKAQHFASIGKILTTHGANKRTSTMHSKSRPSCYKYKYMRSQFRKNTLFIQWHSRHPWYWATCPGQIGSHIYTCIYNKWTHRKATSAFQGTSQQPHLMIFFFHLHCMSHLDFNKLRIIMKKHAKIMVFQHDQKDMCTHSGETECFPQKRCTKVEYTY